MGNQIYARNEFAVVCVGRGYIVINRKKRFDEGHTHIRNFSTAKYIADLAAYRRIPNHLPSYLLVSLKRLAENEEQIIRIESLLENKQRRMQGCSKKSRGMRGA